MCITDGNVKSSHPSIFLTSFHLFVYENWEVLASHSLLNTCSSIDWNEVDPTILGMGPKKRVLESGLLIIINISVFIAVLSKC
jgi:hypothetical protein